MGIVEQENENYKSESKCAVLGYVRGTHTLETPMSK